jgi:hypothetical protein
MAVDRDNAEPMAMAWVALVIGVVTHKVNAFQEIGVCQIILLVATSTRTLAFHRVALQEQPVVDQASMGAATLGALGTVPSVLQPALP